MRFACDEDDDYDARADAYAEQAARRPTGCRCFAPGEAAGTCPGQENCPMCDEGEDEGDES